MRTLPAGRLMVGGLLLVLALGLLGAGRVMTAPSTSGAPKQTPAASKSVAAPAHPSSKACAKCHEAPSKKHFSSACASCHSPGQTWTKVQLAHVTFGAHNAATQECGTCHTGKPASQIACRACHGSRCGKDAKTAADCLECHRDGMTETWVPE